MRPSSQLNIVKLVADQSTASMMKTEDGGRQHRRQKALTSLAGHSSTKTSTPG